MSLIDRVAAAPITWGVDGSPGWGYLVSRERYVREMTSLGLHATELGPDGYLPSDPDELDAYLKEHELPNEWDYFDPAKADEKRECGLHAAWGGKAVADKNS